MNNQRHGKRSKPQAQRVHGYCNRRMTVGGLFDQHKFFGQVEPPRFKRARW